MESCISVTFQHPVFCCHSTWSRFFTACSRFVTAGCVTLTRIRPVVEQAVAINVRSRGSTCTLCLCLVMVDKKIPGDCFSYHVVMHPLSFLSVSYDREYWPGRAHTWVRARIAYPACAIRRIFLATRSPNKGRSVLFKFCTESVPTVQQNGPSEVLPWHSTPSHHHREGRIAISRRYRRWWPPSDQGTRSSDGECWEPDPRKCKKDIVFIVFQYLWNFSLN